MKSKGIYFDLFADAFGKLELNRRCSMRAILVAMVSALATFGAVAQETGEKVTGEELRSLVTGANVVHVNSYGSVRRWTNEPDGGLVASTTNAKYGSAMTRSSSSPGKWSINSDGKYCIDIDWKREAEKWCAFIVKATDGGYYLNSVKPERKIEFSR
jgi:hypothetical protein